MSCVTNLITTVLGTWAQALDEDIAVNSIYLNVLLVKLTSYAGGAARPIIFIIEIFVFFVKFY